MSQSALTNILQQFDAISLKEMDRVSLMDRFDTKFIFHSSLLTELLIELKERYRVLEIQGKRLSAYKSKYFDTPDFKFYHAHHNGKLNRTKFRVRTYLDSQASFFEIKFKTNKDKTIKKRISIDGDHDDKLGKMESFIRENYNNDLPKLLPKVTSQFSRITLVHRQKEERVTLDTNLKFLFNGTLEDAGSIIISEVKRDRSSGHSDFIQLLRDHGIRSESVSKYCLGVSLIHKDIKQNRFKQKLLRINKIAHGMDR